MAQFEVPVVRVDRIEEHPGADALEIAVGAGVPLRREDRGAPGRRPGRLHPGGRHRLRVAHPRAAALGTRGRAAGCWPGKRGDRVKAIRLPGIVSQGLLYPVEEHREGENLAEALDIVKYEPPIPVHMQGEVCNVRGHTLAYRHREHPEVSGNPAAPARKSCSPRSSTARGPVSGTGRGSTTRNSSRGGTIITSKGRERHRARVQVEPTPNASNLYVMSFPGDNAEHGRVGPGAGRLPGGAGSRSSFSGRRSGRKCRISTTASRGAPSGCSTSMSGQPRRGRYLDYDELLARVKGEWGLETTPRLYRGAFSMGGRRAAPGREDDVPGRARPGGHRHLAGAGGGSVRSFRGTG